MAKSALVLQKAEAFQVPAIIAQVGPDQARGNNLLVPHFRRTGKDYTPVITSKGSTLAFKVLVYRLVE
jgi:hypothetical protein